VIPVVFLVYLSVFVGSWMCKKLPKATSLDPQDDSVHAGTEAGGAHMRAARLVVLAGGVGGGFARDPSRLVGAFVRIHRRCMRLHPPNTPKGKEGTGYGRDAGGGISPGTRAPGSKQPSAAAGTRSLRQAGCRRIFSFSSLVSDWDAVRRSESKLTPRD
jgi:hypothetical protein